MMRIYRSKRFTTKADKCIGLFFKNAREQEREGFNMVLNSKQLIFASHQAKKHKPVKVIDYRYCQSIKSRVCVYCGTEIPKGDLYYSYKPIMGKRKSRCSQHPPMIYNDVERFDV